MNAIFPAIAKKSIGNAWSRISRSGRPSGKGNENQRRFFARIQHSDDEKRECFNNHKEKMKTKALKEKFKKRKCVVEHPFGTMRYYIGQIPILLMGKEKVQVEMDLYSTGYNLIRLKSIETVPVLLEKLAFWKPVSDFFAFLQVFSFLFSKKREHKLVFVPNFL